ncbi:MAG: TrmB family transcriptional regulator [Thermoplasmata archaeon]
MMAKHRTPAVHAPESPTDRAGAAAGESPSRSSAPFGLSDDSPQDVLTGGLVHVGLTVHEAQMYHTLLRHGPSTARFAILHSRLDRATGYRILSRLRARGLVTATGYRPQRYVALDAVRLLDRVSTLVRDELELHRIVREIYASGLPPSREVAPSTIRGNAPVRDPPRPLGLSLASHYRLIPGHDMVTRFVRDAIASAHEEIGTLARPQQVPESARVALAHTYVLAVRKGVRVRIVLDYHTADLEFLTAILREIPEPTPLFEVRFFAPQLARLWLVDGRVALRCLGTPGCPFHGSDLGIASEEPEFVRVQAGRFQTTWREAVPLDQALRSSQGSVLAPPSASHELRRWVERLGRHEPRGYPVDAFGFGTHRLVRA